MLYFIFEKPCLKSVVREIKGFHLIIHSGPTNSFLLHADKCTQKPKKNVVTAIDNGNWLHLPVLFKLSATQLACVAEGELSSVNSWHVEL
jgi:hypothetical protein